MTSALKPLTLTGGWQSADVNPGYYVHQGYGYLDGRIFSGLGSPVVTQALLSGIPPGVAPSAPVHITIPADPSATDWTSDAALQLPPSYAATVYPNGTVTLDNPVPSQVNVTPSVGTYYYIDSSGAHHPRYLNPLFLQLVLGNARWPLPGTPPADTFTTASLGSHLGSDFTDIDSAYVAHGTRVHLAGHVTAAVDGARFLLASLPPGTTGGLDPAFDDTTADGGSVGVVVEKGSSQAWLNSDFFPIKPAGESRPVTWASPPTNTVGKNFISGQSLPGGSLLVGGLQYTNSVDYGLYTCTFSGGRSATCRTPGGLPPVSFDIAALLATVDPQPEWFMLLLSYQVNHIQVGNAQNPPCDVVHSSCSPTMPITDIGLAFTPAMSLVDVNAGTPVPPSPGNFGWLAPATPLYTGPPLNPPTGGGGGAGLPNAIWKAGQLSGLTISATAAYFNQADMGVTVSIYPLYEMRQAGLHAGDILDLTGSGWVGVQSTPSTILAGPPTAGLRRRKNILGVQAP